MAPVRSKSSFSLLLVVDSPKPNIGTWASNNLQTTEMEKQQQKLHNIPTLSIPLIIVKSTRSYVLDKKGKSKKIHDKIRLICI